MAELNEIAQAQLPHAKKALGEAQRLYEAGAPGYYPESTVAQLNPNIIQGWNQQTAALPTAFGLAQQQAGGLATGLTGLTSGTDVLTQQALGRDQYTMDQAQRAAAASNQVAAQTGTLGGARASLAANTAATNVIQQQQFNAAKALAEIGFGASGQVGAAQAALVTPGALQTGVGEQQRAHEQQLLTDDINRYNYENLAQQNWLSNYITNIGLGGGVAAGINQGTQAGATPTDDPSLLQKGLGYGLQALDLYGKAKSVFNF